MALPKFENDIAYVSKLDDEPNDVGGLSADELKAVFDKAGLELQEYINEELIPRVESDIEAAALGIGGGGALSGEMLAPGTVTADKLANDSVTADKIVNTAVTSEKIANKAVNSEKIADSGILTVNLADKAVTREKIADEAVSADKIFPGAVGSRSLGPDSVTAEKILTGAVSAAFTASIPTSGWSGNSAPYTNEVTVSGITAADRPIIDIVHSSTYSSVAAEREGWAAIYKAVTAANKITFYATDKPTVALNVQIMAVRK